MHPGFVAFFTALACFIAFALGMMVWSFGRAGVAYECRRDGFAWIDGKRYECAPQK